MQIGHGTYLVISLVVIAILVMLVLVIRGRRRSASRSGGSEQIYIGNLSYKVGERDLKNHFSQYGEIIEVRIVKDRRTGRSKGYAFVTFATARDAKKSLVDHGRELAGRSLVVHIAKPR